MVIGHAESSSDDDDFAFSVNDFAAAKEYEVLDRIGGGTFGEVWMLQCCAGHLQACLVLPCMMAMRSESVMAWSATTGGEGQAQGFQPHRRAEACVAEQQ